MEQKVEQMLFRLFPCSRQTKKRKKAEAFQIYTSTFVLSGSMPTAFNTLMNSAATSAPILGQLWLAKTDTREASMLRRIFRKILFVELADSAILVAATVNRVVTIVELQVPK